MFKTHINTIYSICNEFVEDAQEIWINIAQGYANIGIYSTSIQAYLNALCYDRENVFVLYGLGKLYIHTRDFIAAKDIIMILDKNKNEEFKSEVLKGHYYLRKNDVDKSYLSFKKACEICIEYDSYFLYGLGMFFEAIRNYEISGKIYLRHYNQYNFYEMNTELLFRLGMIFKSQNNIDIALRIFNILLQMNELRVLERSDVNLQIAHLYEKKNEHKNAIDIIEKIIDKTTKHQCAIRLLCWIYYKEEKYTEIFNMPNIKNMEDPYVLYILGRAYYETQNYLESFDMYRNAIIHDKMNPWFWNSIGILYYKNEQYKEARGKFETAQEMYHGFEEAKNNLKLFVDTENSSTNILHDVVPDIELTQYFNSDVFLGDVIYKIDKNKIKSYNLPIEDVIYANIK